jgi:hypothetical protein
MIILREGFALRLRMGLIALFLIILFIGITIQSHRVNATESTVLNVVNPLTGDEWFNFSTHVKNVGDTFIVNITIVNVTTMVTWQFGLQWNSSLLECVNATLPSDNALRRAHVTSNSIDVGGPDLSVSGLVVFGASSAYEGEPGFSGDGVLAQLAFRIKQGIGQSDLSFEGIVVDTFLLSRVGLAEISFTPVIGHYDYGDHGIYGDVNNDGTVNMKDISDAVLAFNSFPLSSSRWNPRADLDENGHVDMRDIVIVVLNFGKHA